MQKHKCIMKNDSPFDRTTTTICKYIIAKQIFDIKTKKKIKCEIIKK